MVVSEEAFKIGVGLITIGPITVSSLHPNPL